jgi:hypothetical protein
MREKINALMGTMRQFADAGVGILSAAAPTRSRDGKGRSSYAGAHLSLASFRESSELEYGADDKFLLYPTNDEADPSDPVRLMTLGHAKSRDGETKTIVLRFHRRFQRVDDAGPFNLMVKAASPSPAARLGAAWNRNFNPDRSSQLIEGSTRLSRSLQRLLSIHRGRYRTDASDAEAWPVS